MKPDARSLLQPERPKSHASLWAFFRPHFVVSAITQLTAASWFGVPVTRGPYRSVSMCSVCMSCECSISSLRKRAVVASSTFSCAVSKQATAKARDRFLILDQDSGNRGRGGQESGVGDQQGH